MSRAGYRSKVADLWPAVAWFAEPAAEVAASGRIARHVCLVTSIKVMSCTGRAEGASCFRLCAGKRFVPEVQLSLDNGRALQNLLQQAAPRYIKALKARAAPKSKKERWGAERLSRTAQQQVRSVFCRLGG